MMLEPRDNLTLFTGCPVVEGAAIAPVTPEAPVTSRLTLLGFHVHKCLDDGVDPAPGRRGRGQVLFAVVGRLYPQSLLVLLGK